MFHVPLSYINIMIYRWWRLIASQGRFVWIYKTTRERNVLRTLGPLKIFTGDKVTIGAFVLLTGRQKTR